MVVKNKFWSRRYKLNLYSMRKRVCTDCLISHKCRCIDRGHGWGLIEHFCDKLLNIKTPNFISSIARSYLKPITSETFRLKRS